MRVWFNGRTPAFQADNAGSIPVTRSIESAGQSYKALAFLLFWASVHDCAAELRGLDSTAKKKARIVRASILQHLSDRSRLLPSDQPTCVAR